MVFDFQSLFGKGKQALAGLDISSTSVKLVELSGSGPGAMRLERYACEMMPRGVVTDGNIENVEQAAEVVRRLWKKSGTRVKAVALAMPASSVITKKIILPGGMNEDELEGLVESEASQYIPFALDEVSLDFDVLGPAPGSDEDVEVMLAASRKEKVQDRVAVAELAGLKPIVMDVEHYAARAAFDRVADQMFPMGQGKIVALFQIGANVTSIAIQQDGVLLYEREQTFGGAQLTQDMMRIYGMSHEEAESRKRSGQFPDNFEAEVLDPFLENASLEVTRAIQFFFTSTPYSKVDHLFMAGGGAGLPGMADMISSRTKMPCSIVSPFEGMQLSSGIREQQLMQEASAYMVACGLAMRRFD